MAKLYPCGSLNLSDDQSLFQWVEQILSDALERTKAGDWAGYLTEDTLQTPEAVCAYLNSVMTLTMRQVFAGTGYSLWFYLQRVPRALTKLGLYAAADDQYHSVGKLLQGSLPSADFQLGGFINCSFGQKPCYGAIVTSGTDITTTSVADLVLLLDGKYAEQMQEPLRRFNEVYGYLDSFSLEDQLKLRESFLGLFDATRFADVPFPENHLKDGCVGNSIEGFMDKCWRDELSSAVQDLKANYQKVKKKGGIP